MLTGLGLFECGLVACGYGSDELPDEYVQPDGVRYLDPRTKDYAFTVDGEIAYGSTALQRVVIALTTAFGSSMGVRGFITPTHHDGTTQQVTRSEVRTCLAPMVSDGSIAIDRIDIATEVDRVPGRLGIDVGYINLATGELETARV